MWKSLQAERCNYSIKSYEAHDGAESDRIKNGNQSNQATREPMY